MALSPTQLGNISNSMVTLYQELEDFIIKDFARRLAKSGQITSTAEWQAIRAKEIGISTNYIKEEVKRITKLSEEEIRKLFKDSSSASTNNDNKIFEAGGLDPIKIEDNPVLKEYVNAAIKQTKGELKNITRSLGFAEFINGKVVYKDIATFYHNQLDLAQMKISTGVADYNSAIKQAIKKLTDSGLRTIDYEVGWSNRIDVAVRRSVLTGVNQMSQQMTVANGESRGLDIVETSAHAGARPNHASWQGQRYSYSGKSDKYPSFVEVCGYGRGDGIGGWNCRHSFFFVIDGVSPRTYTDEYLESLKNKTYEYNGKEYTIYEASQYQRRLETSIRKTKRELIAFNNAGLKQDFQNASIKLQQQKREYEKFSKSIRSREKKERQQVVGFGRGISQKSVQSYKEVEKEANKLYNLGNTRTNIEAYNRDKHIREILKNNNVEFIKRINDRECIIKQYNPTITEMTKHAQENLSNKVDRAEMTVEKAQTFINNAKIVLYDTNRSTIKFISENGYSILNFDNRLITSVPQKWRNKYNKYLEED